jgi:hypothetical protein
MATYDTIATTTLGSPASSITITSIPSTYTDLVMVIEATNTSGNTDLFMRFNSDTGTNYSYQFISRGVSNSIIDTANVRMGYYALPQSTVQYHSMTHIQQYAGNKYKSWFTRANSAAVGSDMLSGTWRNTSAINTITIVVNGATEFGTGSRVTIFGIKAA